MSLFDVKHQSPAQRSIQQAVEAGRMPHAYIFHGPDGVGKELLAAAVAKLLLCPERGPCEPPADASGAVGVQRAVDACGRCDDCRLAAAGNHPDLHLIYRQLIREHPESEVRRRKGLDIGVDVLRHFVIDAIGLTPARGQAKVFIIREADRITPQAQNALLKTLEEPPGAAHLILLVSSIDRLLPTTLSRCQIVRFDALPTDFVRERLAAACPDLPADQADWYARLAGGSVGRAVRFVEDGLYAVNERILRGLQRLPAAAGELAQEWLQHAKALGERFAKGDPDVTDTEATRRALKLVLLLASTWYADVLRVAAGGFGSVVNEAKLPELERVARGSLPTHAIDMVDRLARAERQLDLNAHPQLCVEVLVADLVPA